jgi:FkbM family methyltransferase
MVHQNTIKYLLKFGGPKKICNALIFYVYDSIKKRNLDLSQEKIIKVNNYKMKTISHDTGISAELLIYGNHEPLTTGIILDELSEGMTCIDIGSNIGYYALLEGSKIGEKGIVFAIEPSPENFSTLIYNTKLQQNHNIHTFNFAIGDKNSEIEFLIGKKSNWSKVKDENDIIKSEDKIIKVPVKTLDSFVKDNEIEKIDLLRMDVEGYENNIINGATEVLIKFKPKIMVEIHKSIMGKKNTREILKKLKTLNYENKFYIPRIFDSQIIGNKKDIKKYSISNLIKKLENNELPDTFQITLESTS